MCPIKEMSAESSGSASSWASASALSPTSSLQSRSGSRDGEVLVNLLPDDARHDEAQTNVYYTLQPRPGAGRGQVFIGPLPDGAGHGEVFVGLLPGGGGAVHDDYAYYPWQPRPGAELGEVFIGPLPDGVDGVLDNSSNFAQQTLTGTEHAEGIVGALHDPKLGSGYDGSGALADDLGAIHDNPGMVAEHLRRLLPFAGIGACSVAVNGLAASPCSPAVAFYLFALLLGGLFLVILHVLRMQPCPMMSGLKQPKIYMVVM